MKNFLLISIFFFFLSVNAQQGEFKNHPNGLIYSENAISKLKRIVDSLNLKHKICDINKKFYAKNQTKANYVLVEKKNVLQAKKDLDDNISFTYFKTKYPKATYSLDLLVVMNDYTDYNEKKVTEISSLELGKNSKYSIEIETSKKQDNYTGKWIYNYSKKTDYSPESIEAFYLINNFESKQLNSKYSKLIQYSDCLIDTTSTVFNQEAKDSGVRYYDSVPNKARKLVEHVNLVLKRPVLNYDEVFGDLDTLSSAIMSNKKPSKKQKLKIAEREKRSEIEYKKYENEFNKWESTRLQRLDSLFSKNSKFLNDLHEAHNESKISKSSNDEFEEYIGRYLSKESELELKRNRRVIGGCSMDNSPRIHAMNIALLSAETIKWDIFLKSHLNIMNDRFDRVSDGSYAQGSRNTYIKEIEVLDIDVQNLIIGISLRMQNPAKNHYYSSINRVGRALSESNFKTQIENTLLEMIADSELDDYNRILMYYLFDNYNYNLKDDNLIKVNLSKLKTTIDKLPIYLSSRIEIKDYNKFKKEF